jgi:hypothetical protein
MDDLDPNMIEKYASTLIESNTRKTTTTVREYDSNGKIVKETITEVEERDKTKDYTPIYPMTPLPYSPSPLYPYEPYSPSPIWIVDERYLPKYQPVYTTHTEIVSKTN